MRFYPSISLSLEYPFHTRPAVEVPVETHYGLDSIAFHHCQVKSVARAMALRAGNECGSLQDVHFFDGQHVVHNSKQNVDSRPDRIFPVNWRACEGFAFPHQSCRWELLAKKD
jgi:hypothetical protein